MRHFLLRLLLVLDAVVLFLLGTVLLLAPQRVEAAFHFHDLPTAVRYFTGMWGCVCLTMALGYAVAATNPVRHLIWVQVGIARGILECLVGAVYLWQGIVTFPQAGLGVVVAGAVALAYVLLYPCAPRLATIARPLPPKS